MFKHIISLWHIFIDLFHIYIILSSSIILSIKIVNIIISVYIATISININIIQNANSNNNTHIYFLNDHNHTTNICSTLHWPKSINNVYKLINSTTFHR